MSAAAGPLAAGTPDPAGPPPGLEVRARDGEARRVVRLVRRHGGEWDDDFTAYEAQVDAINLNLRIAPSRGLAAYDEAVKDAIALLRSRAPGPPPRHPLREPADPALDRLLAEVRREVCRQAERFPLRRISDLDVEVIDAELSRDLPRHERAVVAAAWALRAALAGPEDESEEGQP